MKDIYILGDFKKNIEILKNKEPLKEKLIKNKKWYLFHLFIASLIFTISIIFNKTTDIITRTIGYFIGMTLSTNVCIGMEEKKESKSKLSKVLWDIKRTVDLELEDLKKSTILSEEKKDTYYICDGEGTKVKRKRVTSYIGINKKDKLIIFKQIASNYKYSNKNLEDVENLELYLLDREDMKNEGIINTENNINKEHPLIKALYKNRKD